MVIPRVLCASHDVNYPAAGKSSMKSSFFPSRLAPIGDKRQELSRIMAGKREEIGHMRQKETNKVS